MYQPPVAVLFINGYVLCNVLKFNKSLRTFPVIQMTDVAELQSCVPASDLDHAIVIDQANTLHYSLFTG